MTLFLCYNFFSRDKQKVAVEVSQALIAEGHQLTNNEIPEKDRQRPIWSRNKELITNYYRAKLGMDLRSVQAADAIVALWEVKRAAIAKQSKPVYYSSINLHHVSFIIGLAIQQGKKVFLTGRPVSRFHYHPNVIHVGTIDRLYSIIREHERQ